MDLQFDHKTMKKRIKKRAEYLALVVSLVLILLLLIITFLGVNSIIAISVNLGFVLQGAALSIITGAVAGFAYYVIDGWMFLSE